MEKYVGIVSAALIGATLVASPACSSKSTGTLGQDEGPGDDSGTSNTASSSGGNGSSGSTGNGSSGSFSQIDSGASMGTGTCQTGTYTGTFSCGFVYDPDASAAAGGSSDGSSGFQITGNLSFVLKQSTSGELGQDTASGTFVLAAGLTTGMATLSGTLDCYSGQFTGELSGGMYSLLGIFTGPFDGPLTSEYNGTSFSFANGGWSLSVPGEGYCPGSWTATYAGDQ